MALVRLQKLLSAAGVCSRRAAEELIRAGRVRVDGRVASLGSSADPESQEITLDGRPVKIPAQHRYLALYKPRGVVVTLSDERGRDDLAALLSGFPHRVFPVGRLDRKSEGLLLLTDDGELAARLLHPRHHVLKRYLVTVRGAVRNADLRALAEGVELEDGPTLPAGVELVERGADRSRFAVELYEGRNRQIRRMCEKLGYEVLRLVRTRFGTLELGSLAPGAWRELAPGEVRRLREEVRGAERKLRRDEG
ncbi:MAG TPA: rRNA pseudouridine synthase [Candidatus Coatesbacteria bacterium]|nr:rRNA pseudouridine synthase [Candidatus Coatesbacteria bacterium]